MDSCFTIHSDSSKSFKTFGTLFFSCLWNAIKFFSSPGKCLLKGFLTADNCEAVREYVGFGIKQIWDHHMKDIPVAHFEHFMFFALKNSRFLLKKSKWAAKEQNERTYSSCRKATPNTFTRGDKIA